MAHIKMQAITSCRMQDGYAKATMEVETSVEACCEVKTIVKTLQKSSPSLRDQLGPDTPDVAGKTPHNTPVRLASPFALPVPITDYCQYRPL